MNNTCRVDIKHIDLPLTPSEELEDLEVELEYLSHVEGDLCHHSYAKWELYYTLKIERLKGQLGLDLEENDNILHLLIVG